MKKGKRRRGNETNKFMEDRISQMPDEILVSILSLLTMKEAAWTSILSRRWKNMWTFITSSLEFDWSAVVLKLELLDVARKNFVRWVNRVLESHQALIINEFRVGFDLDGINSKCDIDRWINFALGKGVKRLELNLASFWGNSPEGRYAFPSHSLNVSSFNSLTSLSLTYVDNLVRYLAFPALSNLRQLELKVHAHNGDSLLYVTSLIEASPLLYKFVLQLLWLDNPLAEKRRVQKVKKHPHCCLKVVELIELAGCSTDIELAKYLLKNASSLEKITINPRPTLRFDFMTIEDFKKILEKDATRERARQLREDLPPGAELFIL